MLTPQEFQTQQQTQQKLFQDIPWQEWASVPQETIQKEDLDQPAEYQNNPIPASWLITQLGITGFAIGGATIAEQNPAIITLTPDATTDHIAQLISYIKMQTRDRAGIHLQETVKLA